MTENATRPEPAVDEDLLKQINDEILRIKEPPECLPLKTYFVSKLIQNEVVTPLSGADIESITALYPLLEELKGKLHVDKLIVYYVESYPAYRCLRERISLFEGIDEMTLNMLLDQWYTEFYCYLKLKMQAVPQLLQLKSTNTVGTMTTKLKTKASEKTSTPDFCLEICGPSHIINNLVFSRIENDVQIRYHKNKALEESSHAALINFPYVGFEFVLDDDISVKRTQSCDYERFIVGKYKADSSPLKNRLRSVKYIDESIAPMVYTYGFFNQYLLTLVRLIKQCSTAVSDWRKQELQVVINEFLADIEEINMYKKNMFATNTSVSYVIGASKYVRYRFVHSNDVNFIEILTPLVTVTLKKFLPKHSVNHETSEFKFQTLEYYRNNMSKFEALLNGPDILNYYCTQCNIHFASYNDMLEHYRQLHGQQAGVVCYHCKMSVEVATLAAHRWKHNCSFD